MKTLAERLTWARERKELTQAGLGKLAGVSQGTIGNLESGLRKEARRIVQIAAALNVDPLWLADGKGASPGSDPSVIEDDGTYIRERLDAIRSTSVLAGDPSYSRVTMEDDDQQDIAIPLVELRLSAGVSGFDVSQDGEGTIGHVRLDHRFVMNGGYDPARLYALRVRGDSMESKLSDGDTVIIDTADTKLVDGVVYAVNYEGEAVIKRMSRDAGDWWLTSDNPDQRKYHRKVCRGPGCIVVGRAIQAITKL